MDVSRYILIRHWANPLKPHATTATSTLYRRAVAPAHSRKRVPGKDWKGQTQDEQTNKD